MSFVKDIGEGSGEAAAGAPVEGMAKGLAQGAVQGLVQDAVKGAGGPVQQAAAAAGQAAQVAGAIGAVVQGGAGAGGMAGGVGVAGGGAGGVGGIVPGGDLPFFEDKAITSTVKQAAQALGGAVASAMGKIAGGGSPNLEVEIASGDTLDVRNFSVHERISSLFQIHLIAISDNPSIDFDAVAGKPARFVVHAGAADRSWAGLCSHIEQVRVEPSGASTYQISIVPDLWLLTQRKNHRMFQQISEPDIVLKILKEWDIEPDVRIDKAAYKKRKYRVQYAESDFAFISRMLEDAGIAYYFEQDGEETKLVLSDAPHANPPRGRPLMFVDDTTMVKKNDNETVTAVRLGQRVRPGKVTLRDHDYRRPPSYKLMTTAAGGLDAESKLERFHYVPGAFLFGAEQGEATPVADDRGKARTDEKEGKALAQKRLDAKRGGARVCTFETNAHDLAPAMVITISNHPHEALRKKLLIVESSLNGTPTGEWSHHCEARGTDVPFRPELVTPHPKVNGVESATVVGPPGEEIHTDEFGRVRVHFHWDRESAMNEKSSCWIHVSQGWSGAGFGTIHLPRVGQEVLVDFLKGDPDRPIIVGRVYTNLQKVPYKLPDNKTQSGWKSQSTGDTGGYNEIMFEDAQGKELLRVQAEKDLNKLVKNNETETTGTNRTITVGKNRSATVGVNDSTTAGASHSVTIAGPDGSGVTKVTMSHESIRLETSGAFIELGADTIVLSARQIALEAGEDILVQAEEQVVIDGDSAVLINCTDKPPPDEIQMPRTEDEFVDEVINLIPFGRVVELGAKLVLGESTVDSAKSWAADQARSAADGVRGFFGGGDGGGVGGGVGGGYGGGGGGAW